MKTRKYSLSVVAFALALASVGGSAHAAETLSSEEALTEELLSQSQSLRGGKGNVCDLLCPAGERGDVDFVAYDANVYPNDITFGADGRVWYTDFASSQLFASTPSGTVTAYPAPATAGGQLTLSLTDGRVWFASLRDVGAVTSSGAFTIYPAPSSGSVTGLTYGPDGNIWFTKTGRNIVGNVTPAGVFTEFTLPAGSQPRGIAAGLDGNLWVAEFASSKIARVTPAGVVTEFPLPTAVQPLDITLGPDGNLWATASGKVARVTTSGVITEFALTTPDQPTSITSDVSLFGLCGTSGLWLTGSTDVITNVSTAGVVTDFPLAGGATSITLVPWANQCGFLDLWFTKPDANELGKIRAFSTL